MDLSITDITNAITGLQDLLNSLGGVFASIDSVLSYISSIISYVEDFLSRITGILSTMEGFVAVIGSLIAALTGIALSVITFINTAEGIAAALIALISVLTTLVTAVVSFVGLIVPLMGGAVFALVLAAAWNVCMFLIWLIQSFLICKLAKKLHYRFAGLSWIPLLTDFFHGYVGLTMVGDKPLLLFGGKVRIHNRAIFFCIYWIVVHLWLILNTVLAIGVNLVPGIGQAVFIGVLCLYLVPAIAMVVVSYITVKDIADCFVESRKATRKAAIAVTVLDTLLTCGIAKIVYFSTLLRKEPILPELLDGPCEKLPGAENVLLESH